MKLKSLPKVDLPRERLERYGIEKLADFELLAIILGSGVKGVNVLQLSKKVLAVLRSGKTKNLPESLTKIKGLGKAKVLQVIAATELGKRLNSRGGEEVLSGKDVWNLCADMRSSKKEQFVAFYLDTQSRVIERQIISVGILNSSLVHPREVFEPAISLHAGSVIVAHNHPSGDLRPSQADITITKILRESGELLGIPLQDHYILGTEGFLSLKREGLL